MKVVITGSPGTGKSSIAKWLSKELGWNLINEKQFAYKKGIGEFKDEELVIPLDELEKALNKEIKGKKNVILEGHLLCEIKLEADLAIVIQVHPELLEARLESKSNYNYDKILDNVFCEGIDYCLKHAKRNYGKVIAVRNEKTIKEVQEKILSEIK